MRILKRNACITESCGTVCGKDDDHTWCPKGQKCRMIQDHCNNSCVPGSNQNTIYVKDFICYNAEKYSYLVYSHASNHFYQIYVIPTHVLTEESVIIMTVLVLAKMTSMESHVNTVEVEKTHYSNLVLQSILLVEPMYI